MASKKARKKKLRKEVIVIGIIVIAVLVALAAKYYLPGGDVAATVNGEKIMKEDVVREYLKVPLEYRQVIPIDSILRGMIIESLLLQKAAKEGTTVSQEEIDSEFNAMLASYGVSEEDIIKDLEANGATLEEFRSTFRKRLIINKLLEETVFAEIEASNDEVRDYYDENQEQFGSPETVSASHILVDTEDEAKSLRNKALGGMNFAELARENSKCPSAADGGDLGWFSSGQMVKEFEDAAFSLKVNQISDVVETQFGFHVIKLTGKKPESKKSFDEVEEEIRDGLLQQKRSYAADIYTAQLESAADIKIYMTKPEEPQGIPVTELNDAEDEEEPAGDIEVVDVQVVEETAEEPEPVETESYISLGECLTAKGAKMYGSDESSTSKKQKDLFGDDFGNIEYVDCSANKDTCKSAGVVSYPTWIIGGEKHIGKYSLAKLAELSGC